MLPLAALNVVVAVECIAAVFDVVAAGGAAAATTITAAVAVVLVTRFQRKGCSFRNRSNLNFRATETPPEVEHSIVIGGGGGGDGGVVSVFIVCGGELGLSFSLASRGCRSQLLSQSRNQLVRLI